MLLILPTLSRSDFLFEDDDEEDSAGLWLPRPDELPELSWRFNEGSAILGASFSLEDIELSGLLFLLGASSLELPLRLADLLLVTETRAPLATMLWSEFLVEKSKFLMAPLDPAGLPGSEEAAVILVDFVEEDFSFKPLAGD